MTTADSFPALVRRQASVLRKALRAAAKGDSAALHRSRVSSRRLRELIPLFDDAPRKARRKMQSLTRELGHVREMDVALHLLAQESLRGVSQLGALRARQHVERIRDVRRRRMLRRLERLNTAKLEQILTQLVARASEQDSEAWKRRLGQRISARARRLSDALVKAGALYVPERLHEVRIAAKKLRYAIEIAAELRDSPAAALAAQVRKTQVTLGDLQDRQVLLRELGRAAGHPFLDEASRHGLVTLSAHLEREGRALHGQFLAEREALVAALEALRRHVVVALMAGGKKRPLRAAWVPRLRRPRVKAARRG